MVPQWCRVVVYSGAGGASQVVVVAAETGHAYWIRLISALPHLPDYPRLIPLRPDPSPAIWAQGDRGHMEGQVLTFEAQPLTPDMGPQRCHDCKVKC